VLKLKRKKPPNGSIPLGIPLKSAVECDMDKLCDNYTFRKSIAKRSSYKTIFSEKHGLNICKKIYLSYPKFPS
jgi:hypothetical protein